MPTFFFSHLFSLKFSITYITHKSLVLKTKPYPSLHFMSRLIFCCFIFVFHTQKASSIERPHAVDTPSWEFLALQLNSSPATHPLPPSPQLLTSNLYLKKELFPPLLFTRQLQFSFLQTVSAVKRTLLRSDQWC